MRRAVVVLWMLPVAVTRCWGSSHGRFSHLLLQGQSWHPIKHGMWIFPQPNVLGETILLDFSMHLKCTRLVTWWSHKRQSVTFCSNRNGLLYGVKITDPYCKAFVLPKQVLFWGGEIGSRCCWAGQICLLPSPQSEMFLPLSQFSLSRCPIRGRRSGYRTGLH